MTRPGPVINLITLEKGSPVETLSCVTDVLARAASSGEKEAFLLLAEPAGEAIVLGRDQRADSVLHPSRRDDCLRRRSGGKGTLLGEGIVYVGLLLPSLDYLLRDPFPPERTVNRYIRPILGAVESFGVKAFYYGTDYLILNRRRGGYVSFDIDDRGVVLMETLIGCTRPWQIPFGWRGYPPQTIERPLEDTVLSDETDRAPTLSGLASALVGQFERRYSAVIRPASAPAARSAVPRSDPEPKMRVGRSLLRESAIGFIEADATVEENRLRHVAIYGDFIANSPAIRELQNSLEGVPATFETVNPIVNNLFARPGNFLIGVRPLSLITEVILEAAKNYRKGEG
jgi:hypothetical protein